MITIEAREIDYVQVIGKSRNKILIVKQMNSNRPVVVKSEETAANNEAMQSHLPDVPTDSRNNVGAMLMFHGTMFSKLRSLPFETERLTLEEISALQACNPTKVRGLNPSDTWPSFFNTEILNRDGRRKSVVKITYIEELADLNGMTARVEQIRLMRDCLNYGDTSFVFELGQILAVDFFIGNHDRFGETGKLVGPQNIFFQVKDNSIKATGIDTYDIFSRWSNLNITIEDLEKRHNKARWPGRILAHGAFNQREEIAKEAVDEIIEMAYKGRRDAVDSIPSTIDKNRKKYLVTIFHKGMSEAKSILRKKYNLTDNLAALQSGIRSRWNIIRG